jgi:hypothetical protein
MLLLNALANVDFVGVPNTLTLSNTLNVGSIALSILDDSLTEQSETIQLFLSVTMTSDLVVASTIPLQIDILDNDGMVTILLSSYIK